MPVPLSVPTVNYTQHTEMVANRAKTGYHYDAH
jgi:hypothetical protein